MTGVVSFNSNSLNTFNRITRVGILVNDIQHTDLPDKDAAMYALANANASVIPQVNYPGKKITISGVIGGSSLSDLDSRIDAFKKFFIGKDKNLDITYGASTRRYIATAAGNSISPRQKAPFAEFTVQFICSQPFGRDVSSTSALSASGRTASSYTDSHTFTGSAPYQLPIITIVYNSVTGGSSYVAFTNSDNGQGITIPDQTWTASDELIIDVENKSVKRNGVEIDFLGAFPEFEPELKHFAYNDGFTARNFDEDVDYYPRWL